jgi:hypothetical protein
MRVSDLIEQIDDWQAKTIDEVWAELNANTKQFVSDQWWSLLGIAQVIGEANVSPFIAYLKSINLEWVATQAAGRGIPIGDPSINNILRNLGSADAWLIAEAGRKIVSPLAFYNLAPDKDLVATVLSGMQLGAIKREKKVIASTRYNAYCAAMETWDGDANTEPTL